MEENVKISWEVEDLIDLYDFMKVRLSDKAYHGEWCLRSVSNNTIQVVMEPHFKVMGKRCTRARVITVPRKNFPTDILVAQLMLLFG